MNRSLHTGLCGATHHHQTDCEAGDRGVLKGPSLDLAATRGGWPALARECARRCRACARCNVISFSLEERECDWFHDCDPLVLKTVDKPWKTLVVRQLWPPPERLLSNDVPFRSHTVVRWNSNATVRLYIVDDWSAEWVLKESHSEAMVTRVFRRLASECFGRDRVIVDVGANSGYYSLMSAALGCQVIAFEPQPGCHKRLNAAIQINFFHEAMRYVPRPVGVLQGTTLLGVNPHGCAGDYQLRPGSAAKPLRAEHMTRLTTVQHALNEFERFRRILLIKIDTEGAEGMALRSLLPHVDRIDNLVVETTPWRWPPVSNMSRAEVADVYASLLHPYRFVLAYARTALGRTRWIDDADAMRDYIGEEMPGDYWGMADIWFGRDAGLMRSVFDAR